MLKFYQKHLESQLSARDYIFLQILINVLQAVKKVSIEALANALPIPITFESRRKKLQRFLSLPNFTIKDIWTVIVKEWLSQTFEREEVLRVAIDRTSWGLINILMVVVIWNKRSIPIYFELLEKLGSSNLAEETAILSKAIEIFKDYKICVLGDREFCSVKLANWLSEKKISFCLRLKKTNFVEKETGIWVELNELGLHEGISIFLEGVKVTKTKNIKGFNVACKWKRKVSGFSQKEGWFILTDLTLNLAIERYRQRFDIEEMFRDFKTGGYNLESTKVSGERLISLLLLISLAYLSATVEGQLINQKGVQKYVGRVKETGRTERRHSCFYVGLYGHTWVNFVSNCRALVEELLRLAPNKLTYYQRGKRAMQLVTATF